MNLHGIKSGYAFSRNPIILRETFPSDAFDKNGGRFIVSLDVPGIYEGRFFPPLEIDLSEILDAYVEYFDEPPENNTDPVIEIENSAALAHRKCYALFEYDSYESEAEFIVIPGGISRQNFKRLLSTANDAFTARFFNPQCNFFLTTRTSGSHLVIKETELYPLYFICREVEEIVVMECVTGSKLEFAPLDIGVYALDVNALRWRFMEEKDILPNVFEIYMGSCYSCRIVIERSELAKQRYRLKFRNSLGVFEILELTGELSVSPEYSDSEDASFMRYDPGIGGFSSEREKVERKQTITVQTGTKRSDEICFLMDMIGSDEVYLLDLTPDPLKVIPSVESFSYKPRPDVPETFSLKLEISDSDINIVPEIVIESKERNTRVFSRQFSHHFN